MQVWSDLHDNEQQGKTRLDSLDRDTIICGIIVETCIMFLDRFRSRQMQQIMRFAVTGGLAFVIDFGLLLLLTELVGLDYLISATISFVVSVWVNYVLSMMWVFTPSKKQKSLVRIIMFFVLSTMGLFINNAIMWFTVEILAISYIIGKLIATFIVMVFNYITRKMLIEGRKKREQEQQQQQQQR